MSEIPWFKVDDNLAFHAKSVAAGNPAMGLWVRAGSWCAQQLTDGFIPDHMLAALGTKQQAERLVSQKLWDRAEGGYRFHAWGERQPSKGDVEAERAAARDRMKEYRAKRKGAVQEASTQVSASRSPEHAPNEQRTSPEVQEPFGNPDPTRPDPTLLEKGANRATQLPEDFRPTDAHQALASELGVNLRSEWPQFCDHHRARGAVFKDWNAALNKWIRNAVKFGHATPRPATGADGELDLSALPPPPSGDMYGNFANTLGAAK